MHPATKLFALSLSGLALWGAGDAAASHLHGEELYRMCTHQSAKTLDPMASGQCLGFIVGVADSFDCGEALHGFRWDGAQAQLSQHQLVNLVLQWIDKHRAARREEASRVIGAALSSAFPCP